MQFKDLDTFQTDGSNIGYYRVMDGIHAGRVIIKAQFRVDGERAFYFANSLTWILAKDLAENRCEPVAPLFTHTDDVDYSQATWFPDGSNTPMHHIW